MDPITHLALATLVFLATHYVASTPLRAALVRSLGDKAYLGAYTLVSFATLGWMIWAYGKAPAIPLWPGSELRILAVLVMPLALVFLVCGLSARNPTAVRQEGALKTMTEPRGILRVTRHPLMWAFALWAGVHIAANGDAASLIFFGGLLVLALSGTALIDARKARAAGEDWLRFAAATSNIPFAAILAGRNRLALGEIGRGRIAAGLVLFAALLFLHPLLFGTRAW